MYKVTSRWGHQDSLKVEWNLGKRCNYDCAYCPSSIHDNSSPHTELSILTNTVDKLVNVNSNLRVSLTGGEPCVHPDISELLQYIRDSDVDYLSVTTNGTRKWEFYVDQPVDQYVFSLHFDDGDWRKVLDTIQMVDVTFKVRQSQTLVVHVMAHHKHMHNVRIAVKFLEDNNIPFVIRRIRWTEGDHDLFDDMKYDQNDLDWILSKTATSKPNVLVFYSDERKMEAMHANDIIKLHLNKFNSWTCSAGLESLMINWDGDVHRATCRVGDSLGNIYNGSFTVPTEPVVCDRNYCTCAADIPLSKHKGTV